MIHGSTHVLETSSSSSLYVDLVFTLRTNLII